MKRVRILVAVDESAASEAAVRVAAQIAIALKADVSVLHAHKPAFSESGPGTAEGRAVRALTEAGIPARIEVRSGDAADEILAAVRTLRPDLLVMGSRGRSNVVGMLLGSVSQEVVARAGCPVLLVRADAAEIVAPYTIALAVEGVAGLRPLVDITRRLAKALGARVYAVHVTHPRGAEIERAVFHAEKSHGEQALAAAVAWLARAGITVESKSIPARNGVARALADFADSVGADLFVIGAHGPDRPFEAVGIGQAVRLAHLAGQPVLVASEEGDFS